MRYCRSCVLPDTRPNLIITEIGTCNACINHHNKRDIDWQHRELAFRNVVENAKLRSHGYDCVVPVSGGKDSTWQIVKCLEYGLNPLAVTWKTPARTEIGARNLANLIEIGVDHIDYQINPKTERKFMYQALVKYGSTAIPMHMALFNIPLKIASRFDIPLIVWGENSAFEYGSADNEQHGFKLTDEWLNRFGVTHGTTAKDWVSESVTAKELTPYFGPSGSELEQQGVLAVFLGYYFPWDVETSLHVAQQHGFEADTSGARTGYYNYADIDDDFISIHHYLKWYKFGFTRTYDNLSLEIRNGRMTRNEAVSIIKKLGDETPYQDIAKFCQFVGITRDHFFELIEKFRNQDIWIKRNGSWMIDDFLISDWDWT